MAACGSLGAAATFSFFPTKNLGGFGDGGLVTTNDDGVADRVRILRFHGSRDKQTFEQIGANSRLDELQAALLRVAPARARRLERRARQAAPSATRARPRRARRAAGDGAPDAQPIYHLYVVRTAQRDALEAALKERGIGATVYYGRPHHLQPVFAHLGYGEGSLPETERAAREALALPMFPTLVGAAAGGGRRGGQSSVALV